MSRTYRRKNITYNPDPAINNLPYYRQAKGWVFESYDEWLILMQAYYHRDVYKEWTKTAPRWFRKYKRAGYRTMTRVDIHKGLTFNEEMYVECERECCNAYYDYY